MDRHVAPVGHIILIMSQQVIALTPESCMISGEIPILPQQELDSTIWWRFFQKRVERTKFDIQKMYTFFLYIYHTRGKYTNHYTAVDHHHDRRKDSVILNKKTTTLHNDRTVTNKDVIPLTYAGSASTAWITLIHIYQIWIYTVVQFWVKESYV